MSVDLVAIPRPEEILERLMEAAKNTGVSRYEVFVGRGRTLAIGAKKGQVDQMRRKEEMAASVRLVHEERLGFAYTSSFTPEAIERTAELAAAGVRLTDPQPGLDLPAPPETPWPRTGGYDPAVNQVTQEEKTDRVLEMEAAALETDRRVEKIRRAEYNESEYSVWLANSLGVRYHNSGTVFSGGLSVKVADGSEAEMGGDGDFSRIYERLDLPGIGRSAARRALDRLGGRKIPGGKIPVILENRVTAAFLGVLASSFLADNIRKGKSILAGRVGRKIMADGVTLIDDGLLPGGLGTSPSDAEGVPKQTTVLVQNGVLQGFLYDYTRARAMDCQSTGNAGRGGAKSPPGVGITNFILDPGRKTALELADEVGDGLLVTEAMGVHTADSISGDFSLGVSGMWLKNGRPDHPVKGMALAGNLFTTFERVAERGDDFRLSGSIGAPSVLIEELTLSGL